MKLTELKKVLKETVREVILIMHNLLNQTQEWM